MRLVFPENQCIKCRKSAQTLSRPAYDWQPLVASAYAPNALGCVWSSLWVWGQCMRWGWMVRGNWFDTGCGVLPAHLPLYTFHKNPIVALCATGFCVMRTLIVPGRTSVWFLWVSFSYSLPSLSKLKCIVGRLNINFVGSPNRNGVQSWNVLFADVIAL